MKPLLRILSFAIIFTSLNPSLYAQLAGGAPAGPNTSRASQPFIVSTKTLGDTTYRTTIFTFADITVFSYFDSTHVSVLSGNTVINSWALKADTIGTFSTSQGVYRLVGDKPFTVLIGDAITNYVNGYYAMDASGLGVSTKFNTWMMYSLNSTYDPHFIVFGYQNGTQFVIKDLNTKAIIATGALNAGQYYDFPNISSISYTPLQVTSNLPVSVLSYTDQDYYVPSSNGTWAGNLFYGFSGYSGSWDNSITTVSYSDSNHVTVKNIAKDSVMKTYTLNKGQVYCDTIRSDVFWSVSSTGTLAVANIPYGTWGGLYQYMARAADSTGRNVGKLFYVPTGSSRLDVFSFDDSNTVRITQLGLFTNYPYTNPVLVDSAVVNSGGVRTISSTTYGSYVYKIEATKNVSVLQSYLGFGADFMPLNFALQLADLSISQADIGFSPADSLLVAGNKLTISITAHNQGALGASNVKVALYAGDPDAGGIAPLIGSKIIPSIAVGGSQVVTFDYVVPDKPEYYNIVAKLDPDNGIVESNESNNKASRFLKSNNDVKPPLSVNITAPNGLAIDSATKIISPNPFTVEADIFNTGTISAKNPHVTISLFNGLTLMSGPADTTWPSITAAGSAKVLWTIKASKDSSGLNFYSFNVVADSVPAKTISRAVNIPDIIPPASPIGLSVNSGTSPSNVVLLWNPNTERDVAGYRIFYGQDTSLAGKGAKEGDSPIIVPNVTTLTLSGLPNGTNYFAIQAGDFSGNLSTRSIIIQKVLQVSDKNSLVPQEYSLEQNYPNPFNPSTTIDFALPKRSFVSLEIINTLGQTVATLVNTDVEAGYHEVVWNAAVSSGMYFSRIKATAADNSNKSFFKVRKMILMK